MARDDNPHVHLSLLMAGDPAPFVVENPKGASSCVLIADHGGRVIPARLANLGLVGDDLTRHIAWDIGIAGVASVLAGLLDAVAVRQVYSRLVIDCNRNPEEGRAIVEVSDGSAIPGNRALDPALRRARIDEIHAPYQAAIAAAMAARPTPVLVALHSFTPVMAGDARPWHCGVLHMNDSALSNALLARLRAEGDILVGDNEPYAMAGTDYTVPHHAIDKGHPYVEIEIRQDLIADAAGQAAWAARLARLLPQALADVGL